MIKIFRIALLLFPLSGFSQITIDDYNRAVKYLWRNLDNKRVFNLSINPQWFGDSSGVYYVYNEQDFRSYKRILFSSMEIEPLFSQEKLASLLSQRLEEEILAADLPIRNLSMADQSQLDFWTGNQHFLWNLDSDSLKLVERETFNPMESRSPDGKWIAFAENYNLFIRSTETGEVKQLSDKGTRNYEYASYYGWFDKMEGENGDRPSRFAVNWSPDSKYLQTYICDLRSANKMYLLDWSVDTLYRPRLLSYYRGSPGDTSMVYMIPAFYNIEEGKEIKFDLPRNTHINSIGFRWSDSPTKLYASYSERGFKKVHLLRLNLLNSNIEELYTEESATNIDNFSYWLAEDANKIILTSERSGWKQLYSVDLQTKKLEPITNGNYYVNSVERIDEKNQVLFFMASGKEENLNPYYQHLYKVTFSGKRLRNLTGDNIHHQVELSPDGEFFFDNMSTVNTPTKSVLRDASSGKIIREISEANYDELKKDSWEFPMEFSTTAKDGKTTIYGAIWKPTNFDPSQKYPVIDQSYTGPHTNMFPNNFRRGLTTSNQALAELGFIVVTVDGLGTARRSKEFHNYSYKNMGKNLEDHVLAIKDLAKRYPWVDDSRVGIFGHSAGGFDAGHAVLEFPDFYKVGVASSADHDFRMEKAWWPEMYMGWPVDSLYNEVSNITMAGNLKGKLLITHGGLDDNVNPSATFKLAEALVRANKEFDMLIFPSQRHGYTGDFSNYFLKKRWNYFVEHLLGVKPIWDFELK